MAGCLPAFSKWAAVINFFFQRLSLAGLNALLKQNSWAPKRLAGFSGKTFCFSVEQLPGGLDREWSIRIAPDGYFEAWPAAQADLRLILRYNARLLSQVLEQGLPALLPNLKVEGDVLLAAALGEVFRDLQWDLIGLIQPCSGPIIAHRLDLQLQRCASGLRQHLARFAAARPWPSTASQETRPRPSM